MTESFGDYDLIGEAGRGAMGVVYKARHRKLDRVVALKMLVSGELASDKEIGRFEVEARAAAHLDHPNIVKVYDVGQHAGRRFLAMQFIEGRSLADVAGPGGMADELAARIVMKVALAIACAHRQGVLHRDLKPANILLDAQDNPHVTDFGLAKYQVHPEYSRAAMTQTGAALGTPSYMPPEQAAGQLEKIRETADVYGLGAILYELITGYAPFLRPTPAETIMLVLKEDVFPPHRLNRELGRDLETICLRCLEKDPGKRYQSADEVADELQRFLDDKPIKARPVSSITQAWRWCRRNPTIAVASAAVVLILTLLAVAGTGAAIYQRASRSQTADLLYVSDMEVAQSSLESSNLSRALELLNTHRDDERRGFEWYYLWGRCRESLLSPSLVHDSGVWGVACSPDGKQLVTGSTSGKLVLWDVSTWERVDAVSCGSRVTSVAFAPDVEIVAAASGDGDLRIWNLSNGNVRRLVGHHDKTWAVTFSLDGTLLASADTDGRILIWDTKTWQSQELPSPHTADVWGLAFSPGSMQLVSGGIDGEVLLWDVASRQFRKMPDSPGSVRSVAISPDGQLIAVGHADGSISVWHTATDQVTNYRIHTASVWAIQFVGDGAKLVSGSDNGTIALLDAASGKLIRSILGHESGIFSISILKDGRLASASIDQRVKIWDLDDSSRPNVLTGHTDPVTSVAILGQSLASASLDGDVRVWNLHDGESVVLEGHEGPVWNVNYLPDGRLVSVGADRSIIVRKTGTLSIEARVRDAHSNTIRFVVFSPDGRLMATGGDDQKVRVWSTNNGFKLRKEFTGHQDDVQCGTFIQQADKLMLATGGDDRKVLLWGLTTNSSSVILEHGSTVWSLAAATDGRFLVSGGMDGKVQMYFPSSQRTEKLQKRGLPVHAVFVSPQGDLILSGGLDQAVKIWDASMEEYRASLRGHTGRIWGLSASTDERLFASSSADGTIRLWRAPTEKEVKEVEW